MEYRPLEIKLLSAQDLKYVNTFTKMTTYVIASITGDSRNAQRSPIDKENGTNPNWNGYLMKFIIDEVATQQNQCGLTFRIMSARTLGDKEIGCVYVPIKDLLTGSDDSDSKKGGENSSFSESTFQVQRPSGNPKGSLKFAWRLGEKYTQKSPNPIPVSYLAGVVGNGQSVGSPPPAGYYPPPPPAQNVPVSYSSPVTGYPPYPPQQQAYPYPANGYAYNCGTAPAQYGYGQQQMPSSGMGAATGFATGFIGGMFVDDIMEDISDVF